MTGFSFQISKMGLAHTIKYGTRIKTIPKHVQLVPDKYRFIFVRNKITGKNTAIDDEICRLPALNENTVMAHYYKKKIKVTFRSTLQSNIMY